MDCLDSSLLGNLLIVEGLDLGSLLGSDGSLALVLEEEDCGNDTEPVDAVTSDGTDGRDVGPTQDRVQESITTGVGVIGVAPVQGPDVAAGVKGTGIISIASNDLVPLVHLKGLDCLGEKASGDQEQEARRRDKETVQGQTGTSTVDQETNKSTGQQSRDRGQGNRLGLSLERNLLGIVKSTQRSSC